MYRAFLPDNDGMLKDLNGLSGEQAWPLVIPLLQAVMVESSCPFMSLQGLRGFGSNWINLVEENSLKAVRHSTGTSDITVWERVRKMGFLLSIHIYSLSGPV